MSHPELLGSDLGVAIELHRVASPNPGPTVVVFGGVHGDELEGVLATSILIEGIGELSCGTVVLVPRANPNACAAGTRESADDGKNLARCFPGDPAGTYTDRIAHVLTGLISRADVLIDLHSGGFNYAMPFFAGYAAGLATSERAAAMSDSFAAPVSWRHDGINPGRSISTAADLGVPAIYVEGGRGGGSLAHAELTGYIAGVIRVLCSLGMLDPKRAVPPTTGRRLIRGGDGNTDASRVASHSGYCITAVAAGDTVRAGQLIAEVRDASAGVLEVVESPIDGVVMMIRAVAEIEAGDGVVMVAPAPEMVAP